MEISVIKRKDMSKSRCKACSECPMGVIGCDNDIKPHGHGSGQECPECGMPYYKVHPHSKVCSKATPVEDNVKHNEHHMKWQLRWGRWKGDWKGDDK